MSEFVRNGRRLENDGSAVKSVLLMQFGAAVMGIMLSSATFRSTMLNLITSLLAILFYMYLLYTTVWEIGAKDRVRVDGGRTAEDKWRGLRVSLLANIPNLVLATAVLITGIIFKVAQSARVGSVLTVFVVISRFWQGMYNGCIISLTSVMSDVFALLIYFIIVLPSLVICTVSYRMGYVGKRLIPTKKI